MRVRSKMLWLGAILASFSGLCLCTPANTTTDRGAQGAAADEDGANAPVSDRPARFALLLPLRSESLGSAAQAVRAGFLAAYEQEKEGVAVAVVETGDQPEEAVASYTDALAAADIVIGPLTRGCASAIAQSGAVRKPTIALTQSDVESEASPRLPPLMLAMGLSVEDEARQIAAWIASDKPAGKVFAVATSASWQRRAAKAFSVQARHRGLDAEMIELGNANGYLSAADVAQFKRQVQAERPGALFAAMDAAQTRQVRAAIGSEIPIYGTAQLNPVALPDWGMAERMADMDGVRLLDIPWQLQPDHPAVMIYPKRVVPSDHKRSADTERLYALGIDAFRVARLVAAQRKRFEIDGVTGTLSVGIDPDRIRFERTEPLAIYRDGAVVPLADGH